MRQRPPPIIKQPLRDVSQSQTSLHVRKPRGRVDGERCEVGEADDERAVGGAVAGGGVRVAACEGGNGEAGLGGAEEGGGDLGGGGGVDYGGGDVLVFEAEVVTLPHERQIISQG